MTRMMLLIVATMIAGLPAVAQTVTVRSGEHDGFTRVVLQLPDNVGWSVDHSGRSFSIKVDAPSIIFDISRAFDRITRNRLTALSQKGPGEDLVFSLGCACSISSFLESGRFLVVDIIDESGNAESPSISVDVPLSQRVYRFPVRVSSARTVTSETDGLMFSAIKKRMSNPELPSDTIPPIGNSRTKPYVAINTSEERLLAQINRASNQGLLDLRVMPGAIGVRASTPDSLEISGDSVPLKNSDLHIPLSAVTSIDRNLPSQVLIHSTTIQSCIETEQVLLKKWGGGQVFSTEIGYLRAQLFGDLDTVNSDIALDLARAYVFFGFGVEALQVIKLSDAPNGETHILKALAQIFDHGALEYANPFSGQQKCNSDAALWAVLSEGSVADDVNNNAVRMAFSRLPSHLRSHLGPKVSKKYARVGDTEMASFFLRAIARAGLETGSGMEMAKAALATLHGDPKSASQELRKSLISGSEHSPDALVKLIANKFESREFVSPSLPDLAASYALEFRDADIGTDLRHTHAVALALSGQFTEAFKILLIIKELDGALNRGITMDPLLTLLSEYSDDVTFLRISLILALENQGETPAGTADKVARRLLDLGFSEQAALWTASSAGKTPASLGRSLLLAEISLARQLPNQALMELIDLQGRKPARLRAAALWQMGEYQEAGEILVTAGDFDEAARGFWMAENWNAVPHQANALYAQVVAGSVQLRAANADTTPRTPLAEARRLMRNSSNARGEIEDLLKSVTVN